MRQVLVDHARSKATTKRRADGERVPLDSLVAQYEERAGSLIDLDAALVRLKNTSPRLAELVELRFFGGRSVDESARLLGISDRQAHRWWNIARNLLRRELAEPSDGQTE